MFKIFLSYVEHGLTKTNSLNVPKHLCFLGLYSHANICMCFVGVGYMLVSRAYAVLGATVARSVHQEVGCAAASLLAPLVQLHYHVAEHTVVTSPAVEKERETVLEWVSLC